MQLIIFFTLTFAITWGCHVPYVASVKGLLPFQPPVQVLFFGVLGPMIAAICLTYTSSGWEGLKTLFRKFLLWKIGWYWYVFALLTAVVVRLAGLGILTILEGDINDVTFLDPAIILLSLPQWILIVPIEEIGWRGYALPRLQAKYSALTSSIILGMLWGLWHVPLMFLQPGRLLGGSLRWGIFLFMISVILTTIFMTWLYNNTRGSLLIATIFHASANTAFSIFTIPVEYQIPHTIISLAIALLIIVYIVWRKGAKNLAD